MTLIKNKEPHWKNFYALLKNQSEMLLNHMHTNDFDYQKINTIYNQKCNLYGKTPNTLSYIEFIHYTEQYIENLKKDPISQTSLQQIIYIQSQLSETKTNNEETAAIKKYAEEYAQCQNILKKLDAVTK